MSNHNKKELELLKTQLNALRDSNNGFVTSLESLSGSLEIAIEQSKEEEQVDFYSDFQSIIESIIHKNKIKL